MMTRINEALGQTPLSPQYKMAPKNINLKAGANSSRASALHKTWVASPIRCKLLMAKSSYLRVKSGYLIWMRL